MSFPAFEAGDAAVTKWYHFAFLADADRLGEASEAVARCMGEYTLAPLDEFVAEYARSRRRQRELARRQVPRGELEALGRELDALEWEGYRGAFLRRRLEALAFPGEGDLLWVAADVDGLRNRLGRFERMAELGAPEDILRRELVWMAECVGGAPPEDRGFEDALRRGARQPDMEVFPLLLAGALELCCPMDPENLGLGDRYGLLLDVPRLFGDPWTSGLRLPRPLVPADRPRDVAFAERFGHDPQAGDDLGPVSVGQGAELVSLGDRLLAEPPDVRGCKGRIARYARALRRIGGQGGTAISFVGKDPTL